MCGKIITMFRGDSVPLTFHITVDDEPLVLVSGDEGVFAAFKPDGSVAFRENIDDTNGDENGVITVNIRPIDTQNLTPGNYMCELELMLGGRTVMTPFQGVLSIIEDKIVPEVR